MAGIQNSWISATVIDPPSPCSDPNATSDSSLSNCVLWLIVGLLIGSIRFEKKGQGSYQ